MKNTNTTTATTTATGSSDGDDQDDDDAPLIRRVVAEAHKHGVQVDVTAEYPFDKLADEEYKSRWARRLSEFVRLYDLDGVNFDPERPVARNDDATRNALTSLLRDARTALNGDNGDGDPNHHNSSSKYYYISFDAAWSPRGIDGRYYDYSSIAQVVDAVFVMAYDMQSQIFDLERCVADANSPLPRVERGLTEFLRQVPALRADPSKLVLGVPWYGYDYPCTNANFTQTADIVGGGGIGENGGRPPVCTLEPVPFRGAPCSDAAGTEIGLTRILTELAPLSIEGNATISFDDRSMTPYFTYKKIEQTPDNNGIAAPALYHQVWFDCPRSLALKYKLAKDMGLGGVGFWNVDELAYHDDDDDDDQDAKGNCTAISAYCRKIRTDMFEALDAFLLD